MLPAEIIAGASALAIAVSGAAWYIVHLQSLITRQRNLIMGDFTKLNESLDKASALAGELKSYVDGLKAADDQAAIDAAQAKSDALGAAIGALLPPPALAVSPQTLSVAVGQPVTASLSVSGGTAPYGFDAGTSGLSVDASGAVSGSVATAGESAITVTDAAGGSVSVAVTAS